MRVFALMLALVAGMAFACQTAYGAEQTCTVRFYECAEGQWQLCAQASGASLDASAADAFSVTGRPAPQKAPDAQGAWRFKGWSAWPGGSTLLCGALRESAMGRSCIDCYAVFARAKSWPAGSARIGGGVYRLSEDGTASLVGLSMPNAARKLVVPATVTENGLTWRVTSIARKALKGCKSLKRLHVGACVETIGARACEGCRSLKKVTGMLGLRRICSRAFCKCRALKSFACASPVLERVGSRAFMACRCLTRVRFSSRDLSRIESRAFKSCTALTRFSFSSKKLTRAALKRASLPV